MFARLPKHGTSVSLGHIINTRLDFIVNKQTPETDSEIEMDEASQQLLHEHRNCEAILKSTMKSENSPTRSPDSKSSEAPSTPTSLDADVSMQSTEGGQMSALQSCLLTGKFSDLQVVHGEQTWKAHKVVVCAQSPVLESMILDEASTSRLDLKEYPHAAVTRLMQYLYTNSYTLEQAAPEFGLSSLIEVFGLAVSLSIPSMQTFTEELFRNTLNNYVTDLTVYFASVRKIYTTTPVSHPGLRHAVVEAAVTEMKTLLSNDNAKTSFLAFTIEFPEFLTDVLSFLAVNPNRPVQVVMQYLCEDCGPQSEDDKYGLNVECKDCGEMKSMEFL